MVTTPALPRRSTWAELGTFLPAVLLALVMVWAVLQSIAVANWADGLEVLVAAALPGLLVGAIFAYLRWLPGWLAHLFSAALALTWCVRQVGALLGEPLTSWRDQATELLIRTIMLGRVLVGGGRGEDIVLFIAAVTLLGWALAYATVWMLLRRGFIWRPVLLNALVILTNYTYVLPKPNGLFFTFLIAALLLVAYQQALARQRFWAAGQVTYPEFIALRFVATAGVFCVGLIVVTALLPNQVAAGSASRNWQAFSQPFTLAREHWEDAFSTINAPPGAGGNSFAARGTVLGGARVLGTDIVMYVRSAEPGYWRAVAFDRYTSDGWQNTTGEQARAALDVAAPAMARSTLRPEDELPISDVRGRVVVTQTVELAADRKDDLVTLSGTALQVSLPVQVEHNVLLDAQGRPQPVFDDTALIVSRQSLRAGTVYSVTALISQADVQSLRAAGTDYPDWVRQRYLQLPATVTQQTRDLARSIVTEAAATTPYDQAIAIQNYLRTLAYNEQIDPPPAGVEPVDYFLFTSREGYCDYFASAMVVLLRSLDVPARWVQGYAGGTLDSESERFVVRENVAHSWPEVYFPGFGWERFEPTPAVYTTVPQRPLTPPDADGAGAFAGASELDPGADQVFDEDLEAGLEQLADPGTGPFADESGPDWAPLRRQLALLAVIGGSLALVGYSFWLAWRRQLHGLSPTSAAYARLGMLAEWAGLGQRPTETPLEFGAMLSRALPQHRMSIRRLVQAYVSERYRRHPTIDHSETEASLRYMRRSLIRRILARPGRLISSAYARRMRR